MYLLNAVKITEFSFLLLQRTSLQNYSNSNKAASLPYALTHLLTQSLMHSFIDSGIFCATLFISFAVHHHLVALTLQFPPKTKMQCTSIRKVLYTSFTLFTYWLSVVNLACSIQAILRCCFCFYFGCAISYACLIQWRLCWL